MLERIDAKSLTCPGDRKHSHWHVEADALPERHARDVDYLHSGFAKGHMRNAADAHHSQAEMDATHDLQNAVPQPQQFNAQSWEHLEEHARELAQEGATVWIVTLPCRIPQAKTDAGDVRTWKLIVQAIGPDWIWVQTHLAKSILIETKDGGRRIESYLALNSDAAAKSQIDSFLVPTDLIERHAVLDLWPVPTALKGRAREAWLKSRSGSRLRNPDSRAVPPGTRWERARPEIHGSFPTLSAGSPQWEQRRS